MIKATVKARMISVYGFLCWALGVTRKRRTLERLQRRNHEHN